MKVLHISSAKTWRGGERQVTLLIEGLEKLGVECHLMCPADSELHQRSSLDSSRLIDFNKDGSGLYLSLGRFLKKYCEQQNIDIIHGHDSKAHGKIWKAYMLGGLKTKSVVSRRLLNPIKFTSRKKYNDPRIEKIICISEAVKNVLSKVIRDHSRLELVNSAIEINPEIRQHKLKDINSEIVIGYVAAFTEEKNHYDFIKIARLLLSKYPERTYKFLLVGGGKLLNRVKEDCHDIEDDISFSGFVEDVQEMYGKIDILLHTSSSEAMGTAILDAMQWGIPIVASKVGGIPEIVEDGKNGFLYTPGMVESAAESIHQIANNTSLYNQMSDFGKIKVKNFGVEKMVANTLDIYKKVVKNKLKINN